MIRYDRIAWALVEEVPMLMGRMGIFDKFRIIFDEQRGWVYFEKVEKAQSKKNER